MIFFSWNNQASSEALVLRFPLSDWIENILYTVLSKRFFPDQCRFLYVYLSSWFYWCFLCFLPVYMDSKRECSSKRVVYLGGAVVYSHTNQNKEVYRDHIECKITFKAEQKDSKLMMKVVSLDLPDQAYNKLCNDALYVYDANSIFGRTVVSFHLWLQAYYSHIIIDCLNTFEYPLCTWINLSNSIPWIANFIFIHKVEWQSSIFAMFHCLSSLYYVY